MPIRTAKTLLAAAFALAAILAFSATSYAAKSSSSGGGASASSGGAAPPSNSGVTGGVSPSDAQYQPTGKAKIVNGMAIPPADAPIEVVNAINAANSIAGKPYKYGGGHKTTFDDNGYD